MLNQPNIVVTIAVAGTHATSNKLSTNTKYNNNILRTGIQHEKKEKDQENTMYNKKGTRVGGKIKM